MVFGIVSSYKFNYSNYSIAKEGRIFVLTDGQVRDRQACIDLAGKAPEHVRIHTFGIGSGCDEILVKGMAKAGRGCCSMIKDL